MSLSLAGRQRKETELAQTRVRMEDVLHVWSLMTLDWCWRRRIRISPPACPKQGWKDNPMGLLGWQGILPSVPPYSSAASPAKDRTSERSCESCHFCRKPSSLNPKWSKPKHPVRRLKTNHYWKKKKGTMLQQPYFHRSTVLGWGIDFAHPHPP